MQIRYHTEERFPPIGKEVLVEVLREVFGPQPVQMVKAAPGPGVICFVPPSREINGGILAPTPMQVAKSPGHRYMLRAALLVSQEWDAEDALWGDRTLVFDIESHSVDDRWSMDPRDFFRLGQYAWGLDGPVKLTTNYNEMIHVIREAEGVVGHNIHAFDLSVLFGQHSVEPLEMARDGKVFDTMVFANLAFPAPDTFTTRLGHTYRDAAKPTTALKWLGLDNLSFQLGLDGKIGDLKALAKKYGGFGSIPVDDPEFVEYAEQDVVAEQELTKRLLLMKSPDAYDWREQINAGIDAQNSRNGFRVDVSRAQARVAELAERKAKHLTYLEQKYGFPTEGKMPWRSKPGKEAILKLLADSGITPETRPSWTRTKTGNISLGGDVLIELTSGTEIEEVGESLAELMGQRSLAQLALDSVQPDGRVHPEISALQRSGRKSTTKPGLTVWSSKGDKAVEKEYFLANSDDELLLGFDYSNADQRIIAALSGDPEYAKRFDDGVDGHEINGRIMFGDEVYDSNPNHYRNEAKAPGHAFTYGAGPGKLAATTGLPYETMVRFAKGMDKTYPGVAAWQKEVRRAGESGYLTNAWGRRMIVDPKRAHTAAPALHGQSGTREIVVDALIRMLYADIKYITFIVAQVHDEVVFSVPKDQVEVESGKMAELMSTVWSPEDGVGQEIEFYVSKSKPAVNWKEANH